MKNKNILSNYDLFVSIIVAVVGTTIFSYPAQLSKVVGTDGWIVVLIFSIIMAVFIYLINKSMKINNYNRLIDVLYDNFGKIIGGIIALVFVVAAVFSIALQLRVFVEVTKMYLLEKTPTEFIILLMILTGTFLIRGEFENIIRFNEIAFWVMFLPIILVIPFAVNNADITNVLPMLKQSPEQYIQGFKVATSGFVGFTILYMLLPYVKNKDRITKISLKSLAFISVFYVLVIIACLSVFSQSYNSKLIWPSIAMISQVQIPGSFIERWEGLAMMFWMIFYFTTYVNFYYFSSEIVRDVLHLEDVKISLIFLIPFIYAIALYPADVVEVYSIQAKIVPYMEAFLIVVLPVLLLITGFFKNRRKKNEV